MPSLGKQLDNFMGNLQKLVPDTKTRAEMTKAGAKVFQKKLHQNTPRTSHSDVEYGHLQDNIVTQNTDIDGEKNGASIVGFGKKAYVARFLNDGTKKMKATHFVDVARKTAEKDVFEAQQAVYNQKIKGDK